MIKIAGISWLRLSATLLAMVLVVGAIPGHAAATCNCPAGYDRITFGGTNIVVCRDRPALPVQPSLRCWPGSYGACVCQPFVDCSPYPSGYTCYPISGTQISCVNHPTQEDLLCQRATTSARCVCQPNSPAPVCP